MKKNKASVVAKKKLPVVLPPKDRSAVNIITRSEADLDAAVARTITRPEVGSAVVIEAWSQGTHDVNALANELKAQVDAINAGQMGRAEGLLISQAHTLDAIFVNLMRRAMKQTSMPHWDAYMRMGMKAQSQCRATLQALADLKNPPVFAKQANIANGPQQINNGVAVGPASHAKENQTGSIELLEVSDGERLDTGAQSPASGINSRVAPLAKLDRAKVGAGKGSGRKEQLKARSAVGSIH
jgi:hypothetical protein